MIDLMIERLDEATGIWTIDLMMDEEDDLELQPDGVAEQEQPDGVAEPHEQPNSVAEPNEQEEADMDSDIDEDELLASDDNYDSDSSSSSESIGQEILEIKRGIQERKRKRNRRGRRGGRKRNKNRDGATPTVVADNYNSNVGSHGRSHVTPIVNNNNNFLFQLEQEAARWWRRSLILEYVGTPAWREAGFINQQQGFFL